MCQPLLKPKAWANEPKPPRLTEELEEDELEDDEELLDEESKKLLRDERPPLPPEDELREVQSAPGCGVTGAVTPGGGGGGGTQFWRGISA